MTTDSPPLCTFPILIDPVTFAVLRRCQHAKSEHVTASRTSLAICRECLRQAILNSPNYVVDGRPPIHEFEFDPTAA